MSIFKLVLGLLGFATCIYAITNPAFSWAGAAAIGLIYPVFISHLRGGTSKSFLTLPLELARCWQELKHNDSVPKLEPPKTDGDKTHPKS